MGKNIIIAVLLATVGFLGTQLMEIDDVTLGENDQERDADMQEETGGRILNSVVKTLRTVATYTTPAGEDQVAFVLGVDAEGVIVDAKAEEMAEDMISEEKQKAFGMAFPDAVIGKKLSELSDIDDIGGSPLTTGAFNQSLPALKSQL